LQIGSKFINNLTNSW